MSPLYCYVKVYICLCLGQLGKGSNIAWATADVMMRVTDLPQTFPCTTKQRPSYTFTKSPKDLGSGGRNIIAQYNMWLSHSLTTGWKMDSVGVYISPAQAQVAHTTLPAPES